MPSQPASPNQRRLMKYRQLLWAIYTHPHTHRETHTHNTCMRDMHAYSELAHRDENKYKHSHVCCNGTHIYGMIYTFMAKHKLIFSSCGPLTWQMQFVHIWAVGCVWKIWALCLCSEALSTSPVLLMHGVCAQLKEQDLKANKYKSIREIIYLCIYPSINLNVCFYKSVSLCFCYSSEAKHWTFFLSSTPFCERMQQQ